MRLISKQPGAITIKALPLQPTEAEWAGAAHVLTLRARRTTNQVTRKAIKAVGERMAALTLRTVIEAAPCYGRDHP